MTPTDLNDIQARMNEPTPKDIDGLLAHIAHQDLELRTHRAVYTELEQMVKTRLHAHHAPAELFELSLSEQIAWVFLNSMVISDWARRGERVVCQKERDTNGIKIRDTNSY